jgi:mono/diheme cytochrome c family protein
MKYLMLIHTFFLFVALNPINARVVEEADIDHVAVLMPLAEKHCFSCHHDTKRSGGLSIKSYFMGINDFESRIVRGGKVWTNIIQTVKSGEMPPAGEPHMTPEERDAFITSINSILLKSLSSNDPGRVVIRRLSHTEYEHSIYNLVGVKFDAKSRFPSDGSGGAGFDNFPNTLFVTPLKMERYYDAAEEILDLAYSDPATWIKIVPKPYKENLLRRILNWFVRIFSGKTHVDNHLIAAEEIIIPFTSNAFRRFLKPEEKQTYLSLFKEVYDGTEGKDKFNLAIKETLKAVLISPNFLYRYEEEQPVNHAYPLSNFELASRLSFFLWSTFPDKELFEVAYRDDLHDTRVLKKQVQRMLKDEKAKHFSESFATQWFGVSRFKEENTADPERYPEMTPSLRASMYQELVEFFHHVLTESKNFLELVDSDYTFLNEELANHYGIEGVSGEDFRKVALVNSPRGGILGMGSILTSTSLPIRTSPVLRGKWVLEEILGTPAPPPPPDAGDLPEEEAADANASIRDLLTIHRSKPACISCHQKMDPIGFGLENFDAIGRWRNGYGTDPIVAWDTLPTGEVFNGPFELKKILATKKELFARTISEKIFTYAIGRNVEFKDELYIQALVKNLIENNFNSEQFIIALASSYPFRYKVNDTAEKFKMLAKN